MDTFRDTGIGGRRPALSRRGLAAGAVLSVAAVGGVAGCSGGSLIATRAAPWSSSTTQATSTSQTPVAIATTGSAEGESLAPECIGRDLKVTLGREGAGGVINGTILYFTNKSGHVCTVRGYPEVAIMRGTTVVLSAQQMLNGYLGDQQKLAAVPLVTLTPGATASAEFEDSVDTGQSCYAAGSGTLTVTPPNGTESTPFMPEAVGPEGICSDFEIHPLVSGLLH